MMRALLVAIGTLLLLSSTGHAATVIATPVVTGVADGGFTCNVVNVSSSRQKFSVELLGLQGSPVPPDVLEVLPGAIVGFSTSSSQGENVYCRVTSYGRASGLRVSLEARSAGFPMGQTIAIVQGH